MTGVKRKTEHFLGMALLMVLAATMTAYAEPMAMSGSDGSMDGAGRIRDYEGMITDEMMEEWEKAYDTENFTDQYGNEIGWDMEGSGNEDEAGYETGADMMEAPTYAAEEQDVILKGLRMADERGTTGAESEGKGSICMKGELGDSWPGYNVVVALYDNSHKRIETTLYSQDGFEAEQEFPAGSYKVYRAYVPGDENGIRYPLIVSESSIEAAANKTAELIVWRGADIVAKGETEKEAEQETQGERKAEPWDICSKADMWVAAGIGIVLLVFMVSCFTICRKKINHHRFQ